MIRVFLTNLRFAIILLFLIHCAGCGTTKSLYSTIMPGGDEGLKKRIWVLPLLDHAGVGEKKIAQITASLTDLLEKDPHFLVHKGMKPLSSSQIVQTPESLFILDPAIIKDAEEMGINALIVGALNPFETDKRRRGIWPYRRTQREVDISVLVNAVDIVDGSLFLTNLETKRQKIMEGQATLKEEGLDMALADLLEAQTVAIAEELRDEPWRGKIISTDSEGFLINAGRDIGLDGGQVFEVFAESELIHSLNGKAFPILGPKIGEIETIDVMDASATAGPLNGGPFKPGQVIQAKK